MALAHGGVQMNAFYRLAHLPSKAEIVDHDFVSYSIQHNTRIQTSDSNCHDFDGGAAPSIWLSFTVELWHCDKYYSFSRSLEWMQQQQQQQFQMPDKHLIEIYLQLHWVLNEMGSDSSNESELSVRVEKIGQSPDFKSINNEIETCQIVISILNRNSRHFSNKNLPAIVEYTLRMEMFSRFFHT